jgi:hypothetical protein
MAIFKIRLDVNFSAPFIQTGELCFAHGTKPCQNRPLTGFQKHRSTARPFFFLKRIAHSGGHQGQSGFPFPIAQKVPQHGCGRGLFLQLHSVITGSFSLYCHRLTPGIPAQQTLAVLHTQNIIGVLQNSGFFHTRHPFHRPLTGCGKADTGGKLFLQHLRECLRMQHGCKPL